MDYTNKLENIEKIKVAVEVFECLKKTYESLHNKVCSAGYIHRNKLISHVYSDYTMHESLIKAKSEWELLKFEYNIHKKLFDFLITHRDLYGYFPDYKKMIFEFDDLLLKSIAKEEFEIASILKRWRIKFADP